MFRTDRTTAAPVKAGRSRLPKIALTPSSIKKRAPEAKTDRKTDILLAAEKLFAQHGYHAVSIRQIADEAGVPLALVGYHYGPKSALFYAIFARWSSTIEERMQGLKEVKGDPLHPDTLARIIEAFIGPVLRMRASAEGEYYALLVARELYASQDQTDRVLRDFFDPLAHAFIDAMNKVFPHATRGQVAWGYQYLLGSLLYHISDHRVKRLGQGDAGPTDPSAASMLGNFIVGGLRAALAPDAPLFPVPVSMLAPSSPATSTKPRNVKTRKRQA